MIFSRRHSSHLPLILGLAALGVVLCAIVVPAEFRSVSRQLIEFPDSDIASQQARPMVLATLCFLPALAGFIYSLGGTLARYIVRQFLGIFGICLSALFLIYLLIDLSDRIGDFGDSRHILRTIIQYYTASTPGILLLLLPYSLLLSLLHSLGKFSTHREIIAMIQSGRGVLRLTLPLLIAGIFGTALSLGLNYHWAPNTEQQQDSILAKARHKTANQASQVLYRNPENRRLWMIESFPLDYQKGQALLNVEVTQTDDHQKLQSRLSATRALWNRGTREWTFENPVISRYPEGRPPEFEHSETPLVYNSWSETPWQLIKPGLNPDHLGLPDLNSWLQTHARHPLSADPAPYLTQWHYRWALPFSCLVTVLIATPLAIHFSRRSTGGGIFLAVTLSALMLLISTIVITIGEAGLLRPVLAAWLPNLAFALLGIYFFHRRITGQPIYHSLLRFLPGGE
jgi:lipopolysaccharide export system permease protein